MWKTLRDDLTAMPTRSWSDVYQPIRCANDIFIMLDHDHGIADMTEIAQRREESIVVALM